MRIILALLFVTALGAAELEQITTTDGRKLVGTYDENAGTMTLDGPGAAVIKLRPRDVKAREACVRPEAPAPAPKTEAQRPATPPESPSDRLKKAKAAAEDLRQQAAEMEHAAAVEWLNTENLDSVAIPALPADPKQSEIEENKRLHAIEAQRMGLRNIREKLKTNPPIGKKSKEHAAYMANSIAQYIASMEATKR